MYERDIESRWTREIDLLKVCLLLLTLVCACTVIRSRPVQAVPHYGLDFETVSGQRSTTEVFRHGGTYRLHEFVPRTPACERCKPTKVQIDTGLQTSGRGLDFFNRHVVHRDITPQAFIRVSAVQGSDGTSLADRVVAPEAPPPKPSITFSHE